MRTDCGATRRRWRQHVSFPLLSVAATWMGGRPGLLLVMVRGARRASVSGRLRPAGDGWVEARRRERAGRRDFVTACGDLDRMEDSAALSGSLGGDGGFAVVDSSRGQLLCGDSLWPLWIRSESLLSLSSSSSWVRIVMIPSAVGERRWAPPVRGWNPDVRAGAVSGSPACR